MKTKLLFVCLLVTIGFRQGVYAQKEDDAKAAAAREFIYHKQFDGGMRIVTTGLDFYLQYGIIKNIFITHLFTLEYEWHVDYRDKKTTAVPYYTETGRNYYFGVRNRFHVIRFSYGFERALADKAAVKNGVRVSWVGYIGGALGLVKPYYLDLQYPGTDGNAVNIYSQRYSAGTASKFLDKDSIDQASPIWRGLSEMKPVVGGFGRTGLNFDFGAKDKFVKALEVGATLDIFYTKIPIYVNDASNHFMFLGFYLGFDFGKRW